MSFKPCGLFPAGNDPTAHVAFFQQAGALPTSITAKLHVASASPHGLRPHRLSAGWISRSATVLLADAARRQLPLRCGRQIMGRPTPLAVRLRHEPAHLVHRAARPARVRRVRHWLYFTRREARPCVHAGLVLGHGFPCGPYVAVLAGDANRVVTTAQGTVVVAGNATTGDPGKLGPVWLAGLDDAGNVAWQRTFTGVNNYVTSLSTTPSGGFAVLMPSGTSNLGVNILTTDGSGQALWTASIGSDKQNIKTFGMAVTSQGFAVVGGYWDPKVPAPGTLNLGRVAHLDGSGQVVSEASDSEVAVWWMARSTPGMPIAYCGTLNDHQDQTRCVMESDDGKPIWQQDLALTWHPAHAAVRADGGLVLARLHEDTGPGRLPETSPGRIAVARLDPHGAVLWQTEHAWTVPAEMHVEDLVATADGGYALTGAMGDVLLVSAPYIGKAVPPGAIVWYWYALRGDATGRATWARGYAPGGGSGGQARALAPMCDGGIVQVGVAQLSNKPQFPSWVVRTDEMGKAPIALPGSTTQIAVP